MLPGADGKPLKPTTAEQVEAGLKFQPPGSSDLYSIAIYDLTQRMSPLRPEHRHRHLYSGG